MRRFVQVVCVVLSLAAVLAISACISPSTPLSPVAPGGAVTFTGSVITMSGDKIPGATLTVVGGLNKGAQTTTDNAGRYDFGSLQADSFNVLIEAGGFTSISPKIDLFMDIDANFALTAAQ